MEILQAVNLKKYYQSGGGTVKAVDNISFSIEKGSFTAIVGTSGSGKTTLLNLIGGLDYADAGEVIIDGHSIMKMSEEELTVFRRRNIGFVFQNYNLISVQNVYKNIVLPIRLDGRGNISSAYAGSWGLRERWTGIRTSSPEASSRGCPLQGQSRQSLRCSLRMNPRAIWIPRPVRR